jgi:hypothetical protein
VSAAGPFPIDAVYTWVDLDGRGDRGALEERLQAVGGAPRAAIAPKRFRDLGTLGWSVRALLHYAPWIRTVHVVTDGRVPRDLPCDPRIRVVSHAACFRDVTHLPTFNSLAIEANLGFVPGLAEQFIYFNDDVFLGRPAAPQLFFDADGRAICRFDAPLPRRGRLWRLYAGFGLDPRLATQVLSADLVRRLIDEKSQQHPAATGRRLPRTTHQAFAARASVLRALWDYRHIGAEVRRVSASPFRSREDVCPFTLMALVACHENLARAGSKVRSAVRFVRDRHLGDEIPFRDLLDERPAMFCLNDDVRRRPDLARTRIVAFLAAYFADLPMAYSRERHWPG